MPAPEDTSKLEPAQSISTDLGALRDMEDAPWRIGWSRQFALLIVLVTAFVALAFFARLTAQVSRPVVVNAGVTIDASNASSWVAPALEQALNATLLAGDQITVVPRTNGSSTFSRFGGDVGSDGVRNANWRLSAEIEPNADEQLLLVKLRLAQLVGGDGLYTADLIGSVAAIGDLTARSAEQIYAWLGLSTATRQQVDQARLEIPSPAASEAYGMGLAALRDGRGRDALAHFQRADQIEPDNATIVEGIADAWSQLGFANNAIEASGRALTAAAGLTRQRQLELEAQLARRSEDWPRAQQVFSALKEFHPDNLDYQLALAETYSSLDDGEGFLARIEDIRNLAPPQGTDPRVDLTEAWYWYGVGDYGRCLELSRRAESTAIERESLYAHAEALVSIGRCDNDFDPTVLLRARTMFNELKLPAREPEILREMAQHERAEGRMRQATDYLEESVQLARSMGNEPQEAASLNSLAVAYDLRGWLERGLQLKREVAAYQRERGNRKRYAIMLENIGISLFKLGRYEDALAMSTEAEAAFELVDDRIGLAWLPYRRGQIALRQGRVADAEVLIQQAIKNAETRPEGNLDLESRYEVALQYFYSGQFTDAEKAMFEVNQEYRTLGLNASIVASEIVLARIDRQQRNLENARAHLSEAARLLDEDAANVALRLALESANTDMNATAAEQKTACTELAALAKDHEHAEFVLRATARLALCDALLENASLDASLASLETVRARANELGIFEAQLDESIARAAVLQHAGMSAEAKDLLDESDSRRIAADWFVRPMIDQYVVVAALRSAGD